MTNLPKVNV